MKLHLYIASLFLGSISLAGLAADGPPSIKTIADPDLPQTFDPAVASPMLENSPFTRSLNLSDSLVLTGIAYIAGKPVATVLNKNTKESYVISEEPNAYGWKLAETSAASSLSRAQAKVMIGAEIVTIRYSDAQMTPDALKKGGYKPGGGGESQVSSSNAPPQRSGPRPSKEDMDRYTSLSDSAKAKFREIMIQSREKMMNATPEERSAYAKKMFEHIEKDDRKGRTK